VSLIIVGVAGRKRHGKDTVAEMLSEHWGFHRIAYADPLKQIAMDLWSLSHEQVFGDDTAKETIDPRWGLSGRQIMQRIGTEVVRSVHAETWTRKAFDTIQRGCEGGSVMLYSPVTKQFERVEFEPSFAQRWVLSDVRFPNEADAVKQHGGTIIKVVRPALLRVGYDEHSSEKSIDDIEEDHLIINDGPLELLYSRVKGIIDGIFR